MYVIVSGQYHDEIAIQFENVILLAYLAFFDRKIMLGVSAYVLSLGLSR